MSSQFYADALGIPVGKNSVNDLMTQFFMQASRLPTGSYYTRNDHEYDYYKFKLGLTGTPEKSISDLREMYYDAIGAGSEQAYEAGQLRLRTNWCLNPSFETNLSNWAVTASTRTREVSGGYSGAAFSRLVPTTDATSCTMVSNAASPVVAEGQSITYSLYCRGTVGRLARIRTTWSGGGTAQGTQDALASTTDFQRVSVTAVAPPGTSAGRIDFLVASTGILVTDVIDVDGILAEVGTASLLPYFDGNTAGARWLGAVNNSASQLITWTP